MRLCKYRKKDIMGTSCSLGISPMRCYDCSSFAIPTVQDRHSADVGVVAISQRMVARESEPANVVPVVESRVLTQGPIQGGCGCKKKQNG